MRNVTTLSETSPTAWSNIILIGLLQADFLAVLVLAIFPIIALWQLTYPRSTELIAKLSILIHPIFLWGVWAAAKELCQIKIDHAIAYVVEKRSLEELRQIKDSEKERIAIERINQDILPHNLYETAMMRLFQHIIMEAKDHKFDSAAIIMQPYREESLAAIFKLQTIQRIALQLGILGTFIGLISALPQLALGDTDMVKIIDLDPLISALHISFSTSVAGLEVSILLGVLIMLVRKKQNAYFSQMESTTLALMSLTRNAINKDDFFTEFSQIRNFVQQLSDRVYDQSREIEIQTQEIKKGLGKLKDVKVDLYQFLDQIGQTNSKFISEMKEVYNLFSPKTIAAELQSSLTKATESISTTFNQNLVGSLDKLTTLNETIVASNESLKLVEKQLKAQMNQVLTGQENMMQTKLELEDAIKRMSDAQSELMIEIRAYSIDDVSKRLQESIIDSGNKISFNLAEKLETLPKEISMLNRNLSELNQLSEKKVSQRLLGSVLTRLTANKKENEQKND